MHTQRIEIWQHKHGFNIEKRENEKRTSIVVIITFISMLVEIIVGWKTNSMALYADGWHMGTHAFALGVSTITYMLARRYSRDKRFTFGTWKIEILGAYSSAMVLGIVGVIMIFTSMERFISPLPIHYNQAIFVAFMGLSINVICALILNSGHIGHTRHNHQFDAQDYQHDPSDHSYSHDYDHDHPQKDKQNDLNFKSAYLHVIADALTSVLAIIALIGAKYLNFNWLDPLMGIVGAGLILRWSISLLKDTTSILLDQQSNIPLENTIKEKIESDGDTRISDLHLWKVEQNRYACIIALVTGENCQIEEYQNRLRSFKELVHITIEVNQCKYCLP